MIGDTRRTILGWLFGAGGLAIMGPAHALATGELALPPREMRLTRRLRRQLGGEAVLEIRRSWDVGFIRQGRGVMITGVQVSAAVDAPPHLAELARIEQSRSTAAMFPIALDEHGVILDAGRPDSTTALADAVAAAQRLIARAPGPATRDSAVQQHLAQLQQAGASLFDRLPGDLFFPSGEPAVRSGTVPLPDGTQGEFALTYSARPVPGMPWLAEAAREVVTRIGGFERRSREEWEMVPDPPRN